MYNAKKAPLLLKLLVETSSEKFIFNYCDIYIIISSAFTGTAE